MKIAAREKFTATIFVFLLLLFSALNLHYSKDALIEEIVSEGRKIKTIEEATELVFEIDTIINEELLGRMLFIETYGAVQKLLNKKEYNNFDVVRTKEGMMYNGSTINFIDTQVEVYAKRVRRLNEYVISQGKKMLFVLPPDKIMNQQINPLSSVLPIADANATLDLFLWKLQENSVPALDLRTTLMETELTHSELFYKTDHHWTAEASFHVAKSIVEDIDHRYGDNWDEDNYFLNKDNYYIEYHEDALFGSMGRNVGEIYSGGAEDFTLIRPKFPTDFTYTSTNSEGEKRKDKKGSFEETLLDLEDVKNGNADRAYLNTISTNDKIVNHNNENGPSLLVLRDSYFSPVATFLAPMCSEIEMIWVTSEGNPTVDFEDYVKKNIADYDYVIVEVYPGNLDEEFFDYFK